MSCSKIAPDIGKYCPKKKYRLSVTGSQTHSLSLSHTLHSQKNMKLYKIDKKTKSQVNIMITEQK